MAGYSGSGSNCRYALVLCHAIASFIRGLYCHVAYRAHGGGIPALDASSNKRVESIATGTIPAWHSSHEYAAAGHGGNWNGGRHQHPDGRHGEILAWLLRSDEADRNRQSDNRRIP